METIKTIDNSSQVEKVKYNSESKVLTVTFKPGKNYEYAEVPQDIFDGLLAAESAGKYLNQFVKPTFKCKAVQYIIVGNVDEKKASPTTPAVDDNDNF